MTNFDFLAHSRGSADDTRIDVIPIQFGGNHHTGKIFSRYRILLGS